MIKKECSLTVPQRQQLPPRNLESGGETIGEKSTMKMKVNSYQKKTNKSVVSPSTG